MKAWLQNFDWDAIVEINQALCEKGQCPHKQSSGKGDRIKTLWENHRPQKMTLEEMVMFCKRIHFAEPFIMLNGNTFAAVALRATQELLPKTCGKTQLDEAICTIIAGTVQSREEFTLQAESLELENPTPEIQ